ncbi:uncharacterized protein LOC134643539 [Pelmatolapia mariae]|uniref:uncharacterized protein LOC134643539 n=1 Tax=Pelmatolapia mariae TaxID=158779 RepID=UPI003211EB3A
MDILLKEIRRKDEAAASVLEQAGLRAGSDLQLLTLQELGELLPGVENFKLRREIFDIIHTQKPIDVLIEEFKDFIPHESLRAALTENGVLVDYLKMLKEMKTQMNNDFLDRHISLLEDFRKSQPSQDQDKGEIMDILLKEIRRKDGKAASVLEEAGLRADSDLQSLTLQDLGELFPGVKNAKLRRKIFDVVHKQKPMDVLIKEFKDFIPHESLSDPLTENGVLVNYLKMLKEMKTQRNKVQEFLDAHINLLEDLRKSQPSQDKGKIMDILLKEIRRKDGKAASVLEEAGLRADSDLQLLTLQDLGLLFPGVKNAKQRIEIFAIIHTQKQIDVPIEEFKDFIPHESLSAALTENRVLVNYLKMLKEMKTQMNKVQDFLAAHINLLEDFRKSQPLQDQEKGSLSSSHNSQPSDPPQTQQAASSALHSSHSTTFKCDHPEKRQGSLSSSDNSQTGDPPQIQQDITASSAVMSPPSPTSTPDHPEKRSGSFSSSPAKRHNSQTSDPSQIQQDCSSRSRRLSRRSVSTHVQPQKRQVTFKMVVSGVTFDAHKQLLDRLTTSSGNKVLKLLSQEEGEVIIVFCPVVSRMGTDVEAATAKITGDKPVILVVMHHAYEAKPVPSVKTWKDSWKVVLCVHVFYHEKLHGLLPCQENNDAIFKIQTELLKYGVDITESTSGDTWNRAAKGSPSSPALNKAIEVTLPSLAPLSSSLPPSCSVSAV